MDGGCSQLVTILLLLLLTLLPYSFMGSSRAALLSGKYQLLQCGLLPRPQCGYLLRRGPLHGLQGKICSEAWTTSSPSFFSGFGVCTAVPRFFPLVPLHVWHFHRGATHLAAGLSCVLQWVLCSASWNSGRRGVTPASRLPCCQNLDRYT